MVNMQRFYDNKKEAYTPLKKTPKNKKRYIIEKLIPNILVEGDAVYEGDTFKDPLNDKVYTFKLLGNNEVSFWEWGGTEYWYKKDMDPDLVARLEQFSNLHYRDIFPVWGA